jgi:hypothetical protein
MMLNDLTPAVIEKVNAAIAQDLGLWLTPKKEETIKATYGDAVASVVERAYTFSVNHPVDWSVETYEAAIEKVNTAVKRAYPFLDEASVRVLTNCFAYSWK